MTRVQKIVLGASLGGMAGLFFLIFFGNNGLVELLRKRDEYHHLETSTQLLIQENARLYRMVDRLNNDPSYVESVARQELGMVRADETIFTFASKLKE